MLGTARGKSTCLKIKLLVEKTADKLQVKQRLKHQREESSYEGPKKEIKHKIINVELEKFHK